jgi:hypothetical protein
MVGVHRRRDTWVSTADNQSESFALEDEVPKSACMRCADFGFYYLLGPRKYSKQQLINGQVPRDAENWLQCPNCGDIVGLVHVKQESEIAGIKDPDDNIHNIKRLYIEHFIKPRSTTIRGKNKNIKRVNRLSPEDEDTDLQSFLENGRQLTNYYSKDS